MCQSRGVHFLQKKMCLPCCGRHNRLARNFISACVVYRVYFCSVIIMAPNAGQVCARVIIRKYRVSSLRRSDEKQSFFMRALNIRLGGIIRMDPFHPLAKLLHLGCVNLNLGEVRNHNIRRYQNWNTVLPNSTICSPSPLFKSFSHIFTYYLLSLNLFPIK